MSSKSHPQSTAVPYPPWIHVGKNFSGGAETLTCCKSFKNWATVQFLELVEKLRKTLHHLASIALVKTFAVPWRQLPSWHEASTPQHLKHRAGPEVIFWQTAKQESCSSKQVNEPQKEIVDDQKQSQNKRVERHAEKHKVSDSDFYINFP